MDELKVVLTENNIHFRINQAGYILYSGQNKQAVERIELEVKKSQASKVGHGSADMEVAEYPRALLRE